MSAIGQEQTSTIMYCPNCNSNVAEPAAHCTSCDADFTAESSWKPVSSEKETRTRPPVFSGQPKLRHAAQSIPIFLLAGPVIGLVMFALHSDTKGSLALTLNPFAIIGAFTIGGLPAFVAGLLYCCITLTLVSLFPNLIVGRGFGSAVGFVAGGIAATAFSYMFMPKPSDMGGVITGLSMASGLVSGFVAARLVPVGRQQAEPRLSKPYIDRDL